MTPLTFATWTWTWSPYAIPSTIIMFVVVYLIASISNGKIYLYLTKVKRDGENYINKYNKSVKVLTFGTSVMYEEFGFKPALIVYILDFARPAILFWGLIWPLFTFTTIFNTMYIPIVFTAIMIGNTFQIYTKFKYSGKGIATGVGMLFCFNWIMGLVGFFTWVFLSIWLENTKYKLGWVASIIATILGIVIGFIPAVLSAGTYPKIGETLAFNLVAITTLGIPLIIFKHKRNMEGFIKKVKYNKANNGK